MGGAFNILNELVQGTLCRLIGGWAEQSPSLVQLFVGKLNIDGISVQSQQSATNRIMLVVFVHLFLRRLDYVLWRLER